MFLRKIKPESSQMLAEGDIIMIGEIRTQVITKGFFGSELKIEQKGLKLGFILSPLFLIICCEKKLWMKECVLLCSLSEILRRKVERSLLIRGSVGMFGSFSGVETYFLDSEPPIIF